MTKIKLVMDRMDVPRDTATIIFTSRSLPSMEYQIYFQNIYKNMHKIIHNFPNNIKERYCVELYLLNLHSKLIISSMICSNRLRRQIVF